MKFLGLDYGAKRIGLAVSDESATFAFPKDVLPNDESTFEKIQQVIEEERIRGIVVGDARAEGGGQNAITDEADAFAKKLEALGVPVERSREAWSSQEAARFAPPGEKHNDAAAAAIILQRFLDARPA